MPAAILVLDFDGTVTTSDVGDNLCDRLAPPSWRDIDAQWVRGELSLPEAQRRMWGMARATREQAVGAALQLARLRPGLDALLAAATARDVEPWLASGGFDFYIEALLGERLPRFARRYANRMRFQDDRLIPEFPHRALACARCAVCKGVVCDLARALAPRVLFAGDGHSDLCVLGRAAPLFAVRGSALHAEALATSTPVTPFDTLDELLRAL